MFKSLSIALLVCLALSSCSANKRAQLSHDWHNATHQASEDAGNFGHAIVKGAKNVYHGSKKVVKDIGEEVSDMADEVKDDLY